jgi:hypothetical protein
MKSQPFLISMALIINIFNAGNVFSQWANRSLSNLIAPTQVNVHLLPEANNTKNLGSTDTSWRNLYLDGSIYIDDQRFLTNGSGTQNTFLGALSGNSNTGDYNTADGYQTLYSNSTGSSNSAFGNQALVANTTGNRNTALGGGTLYNNTSGYDNTATGHQALFYNTTGYYNTSNGFLSLYTNSTGNSNTAFGYASLYLNTVGVDNTGSGIRALYSNSTGSSNVAHGYHALYSNTSGNQNTCIGASADVTTGALSNASALGYNAQVCNSNMMVLGNSSVTKWGFGICPGSTNIIEFPSALTSAKLTTGGVWTDASDENLKENFEKIDGKDILDRINKLKITRWNYKTDLSTVKHIGPMAQEFYKYFHVGDSVSIAAMDKAGIALIAIQELYLKTQKLEKDNEDLKNILLEITVKIDQLKDCDCIPRTTSDHFKSPTIIDQNLPNPFSEVTEIKYFISEPFITAVINIYDLNGNTIKSFPIANNGSGKISLTANELIPGMYLYAMVINGQMADSKKMILTK